RNVARSRRSHWSKRTRAGAAVPESCGSHRPRLDETRRHGQGRHRRGDREGVEPADSLRGHRRKGRRSGSLRPTAVREWTVWKLSLPTTTTLTEPTTWTETDRRMMARALELSLRAVGQVSPGPLVGCVVVSASGEIVGEGFYIFEQIKHAETIALDRAGERARGGTAYVSLEPHA